MDEQRAPRQTQTKNKSIQRVEARMCNLGGMQRHYSSVKE